jgi:hypothetical protein
MSKMITSLLALALTMTPAFALDRTPATAPVEAATRIETQVPATTTGAVFVNVSRIFKLYGDLIKKTPQYTEFEKYIAAGFPNPETDLDQIGLVSNIENFANSSFGVVVTGSINMERLMAFAQANNVAFTPSMYRGVTLMTSKLDGRDTQLGFVDEKTTLVSVDPNGQGVHQGTKDIVATLKKEAPSFSERNLLTLPADYLANLSLQVPAELAAGLDEVAGGQFAVLKSVKFVAASVRAEERTKDAVLAVTLTNDTEENAVQVEQLLTALAGALGSAGRGADVLSQIKITREGKNVTLSLTIPKADMESWVANN